MNVISKPGSIVGLQSHSYLVKNVLELVLCQSTALDILDSTEFLGHALSVLPAHRRHLLLGEFVADAGVVPQVNLGAHNEARDTRAVVVDLGEPLLANVLEGRRGGDAEADQKDVGLGI